METDRSEPRERPDSGPHRADGRCIGESGQASRVHTLLATGTETGGNFALIETRAVKGAGALRHIHKREDELVYLLEGRMLFERGGVRIALGAGECLFLPRAVEHSYRVESDEARLLTTVSPAGIEGYVREMDESQGSAARFQDIERIVVIAARYGISITGPCVLSEDRTTG